MRRYRRRGFRPGYGVALVVAGLVALVAGLHGSKTPAPGPAAPPTGQAAPSSPSSPAPSAGLEQVSDPGTVTGTIRGRCHVRGTVPHQLPDPSCTPGSYDPGMTAARLCPDAHTRSYRPPERETERIKYDQAYPDYGIPPGTPTELDHLVPLELGGSNDASNLWPEAPPTPNPKDSVEDALHKWVCSAPGGPSGARLHEAQAAIAKDWLTAERVLGT
jgi:hypothetical protein